MTEYNKIFIDTSPYIYYLEKNPMYYDTVKKFFMDCYEDGNEFVTSMITVEEYSIIPYRDNNMELLRDFDKFMDDMETEILEINREIALKAAEIRAEYKGFKAMDALQLSSAVISGCDLFLTNDKQLKQFTEIECMTVEELKANLCS